MSANQSFTGRVVRVGDNVNTDLILPGAYLNLVEPEELGEHLLEGYDAALGASIGPGDIIVGGTDFGGGSSREQAQVAILAREVGAVVAASFSRIFLRNSLNLGLLVIESPEAVADLQTDDRLTIDPLAGRITLADGRVFETPPHPPFVRDLIAQGGLVPWVRHRLEEQR